MCVMSVSFVFWGMFYCIDKRTLHAGHGFAAYKQICSMYLKRRVLLTLQTKTDDLHG